MKVAIINGFSGCGKDSFVTACAEVLGAGRVGNVSTVDYVKEIATECGWDGTKTPENRKFLSDLKRVLTEWNDKPLRETVAAVDAYGDYLALNGDFDTGVIFVHCREPKEIDKLVKELEPFYEVTTLLVRREEAEKVKQINNSDNGVFDYLYDYTIWNNDSLDALRGAAEVFLREYLCLDF